MNRKNPRQSAFEILAHIEKSASFADTLVDRELSTAALHGPDRGFLTELVFGVLRRQGTLDYLIDCWSSQKTSRLERSVLILLRLGVYQIHFLDRVPVSAAVNETVKLAKRFAPRAAGFINAVLRRADREREAIRWPDRESNPVGFLSARHSHPRWLVELWSRQVGPEEVEALAAAMSEPPSLILRTNTLKITRERLLELLANGGVQARATDFSPFGIRILTQTPPLTLPGFQEGLFTVQDESSQLASLFVSPLPGEAVLDLCAAPGGKATHLAQLMENRGSILACDRDERKLGLVRETAERLGISTIETRKIDASGPLSDLGDRAFDRILLDAPCSGLGVLRRNPEAKWRLTPEDPARMALLQGAILRAAADRLADGGVLLYSTCSTSVEENEQLIDDFVSERNDFMVEDLQEIFPDLSCLFTDRGFFRGWPHRHGMDGFTAVRLRRRR
ncbi:MAG TPA: 16S rRNA (cytosine(967)-C(5))-methyltransferase RsmB [Geobacteraceae bacterium]|nr:16S rRNA (cytosine(967)-C(5))-methyltransferase RsmB [Geobacteraceae bacterium]